MLSLQGKTVVVVGLGASGVCAASLALKRGARVAGVDAKPLAELSAAARALEGAGVSLHAGAGAYAAIDRADLVVVSPGVPPLAEVDRVEARGIPVIGEVELAFRALPADVPVVAIGGTNGKSTTTTLAGALLQEAGLRTFVGGNLGEPLSLHVDETWDAVVLEVSSFQMERIDAFRPRVAALLNVTPDHLDRYPSLDAYARAKGNMFQRQREGDVAIVPVDDALCLREAKRSGGRVVTFGPGGDVDVQPDEVVDRARGERYARADFGIRGGHNAMNAAAAIAVAAELRVSPDRTARVLASFRGLEHRMAPAGTIRGVRFYDDSKGTNVGASVTAIRGIDEAKCVLVAGGRDKGGSYEPLASALRERGRAVVVIGEAADRIASAVGDTLPVDRARTMDEAVAVALSRALPGDAVLLSPACSSFDMFKDYKDRGDAFVRAVRALAAQHAKEAP